MNLLEIASKNGIKLNGVVHVGAHKRQEDYADNKVLWIEPQLDYAGAGVISKAIDAVPGVKDFYITTNDQTSSLLVPLEHKVKEVIKVEAIRLDSLDLNGYNALVVDTQGSELGVIKSAGQKLEQFDIIILETNDYVRYKDGCNALDIAIYMNAKSYKLIAYEYHPQPSIKDCAFIK